VEDPRRCGGVLRWREKVAKSDRTGPQKVGEILEGLLKKKRLREPVLRMEVLEEWDGRVGEAIARVTHALAVREGTLIVEVKSSAWLMELDFMKGEILRRVNEGREEALIEKIVFVLSEQ
jgi:predicted nucleic acid-binding Zn ribbon protein